MLPWLAKALKLHSSLKPNRLLPKALTLKRLEPVDRPPALSRVASPVSAGLSATLSTRSVWRLDAPSANAPATSTPGRSLASKSARSSGCTRNASPAGNCAPTKACTRCASVRPDGCAWTTILPTTASSTTKLMTPSDTSWAGSTAEAR